MVRMKKRAAALLLCLTLLLALLPAAPLTAQAAGEVWDGTVDISWYDPDATEYHLYTPAQLAGLAALVNGNVDAHTTDDMIIGDKSLLTSTPDDTFGFPGQSEHAGTALVGSPEYSFADKTIYLEADMDMGGETEHTNWMPIGGLFALDPEADDYMDHVVYSWFAGSINGQGHKITNLYCYRETPLFHYSQGIGLIGQIGTYDGQEAPSVSPTISNLSVSGFVQGGRMSGGIVGRTGSGAGDVYIINCANHAEVCGEQSKGKGGILGVAFGGGAIINCYNDGEVHTTYSSAPAGGIVGDNDEMDVYCCYSVGTVTANYGRAIGSGDTITADYTVSDCYYLDTSCSQSWYTGSNTTASVSVTALSDTVMKSTDLVAYLNVNGAAYVYNPDGYPILFWEQEGYTASECSVSVTKPEGGAVTASVQPSMSSSASSVPYGTVIFLSYEPEAGYAFRKYIANGSFTTGSYYTVTGTAELSASLSSMQAGILNIPYNPACEITVYKTGTVEVDGTPTAVSNYKMSSGDYIYENDVLTAQCTWREGAYPSDPNMVYIGMVNPSSNLAWQYAFTYTGGEDEPSLARSHTVTSDINQDGMAITLTVYPQTTEKVWSSLADTSWYSSSGTEFALTTARQLAGMIVLAREGVTFAGQTIRLGCDIALTNDDGSTGSRCWDGIGMKEYPFSGTFDGQGHTISFMQAKSTGNNIALFNYCTGAVIKDVTVSGSSYAAAGIAAGLVCRCADTTITGCRTFVSVSEGSCTGTNGGIAAEVTGASIIENCFNYGDITGADKTGGIAGMVNSGSAVIRDCVNYGVISGDTVTGGSGGIGGIIGYCTTAAAVSGCANYAAVSGGSWYVGGVIGFVNGTTAALIPVSDCYNAGSVSNSRSAGIQAAGGLLGGLSYGTVTGCHNVGTVTGPEGSIYLGAVVGRDLKRATGSLTNICYLDTSCSYAENSGSERTAAATYAVTAMTAEQMAGTDALSLVNADGVYAQLGAGYPEFSYAVTNTHIHSGGTADCSRLAVCEDCGCRYGEYDATNHADYGTVIKNAVDPVWSYDGYSGDVCCTGCGAVLQAGQAVPADQTQIVFTVYEQTAGGDLVKAKEFTAQEMNALECQGGPFLYQYGSSTEDTQVIIAAARGVELFTLLDAAGVSFTPGDKLQPENASDFGYDYIVSRDSFYYTDDSGKVCSTKVPALLAFSYGGSSAGDTQAAIADCSVTGHVRLCYGIQKSEFLNCGGFRLVGNVSYIVIKHPACTKGDVNEDGKVDLMDVSMTYHYITGSVTLSAVGQAAANMDDDRSITLKDVAVIYRSCT